MEPRDTNTYPKHSGFTLIELLVVIGLMGLLFGGIGLALAGAGRGDVSTGERVLQGLLISARTQAVIQRGEAVFPAVGSPAFESSAMLLINANPDDTEGFLSETVVVYWGEDVDGNVGWLNATGFDSLPSGVLVEPDVSGFADGTFALSAMQINLDRPSAIAQGDEGDLPWYFIPFNTRGRLNGIDEFSVVLGAGSVVPGSSGAEVIWEEQTALGGYMVLGMGAVYRFPEESVIPNLPAE